ncbi:hypothetical protein MUG91_G432n2 [Manis pentadactyla]|nr:hypothetical protein MUG91_G432n2 [Manis pentadactyla]
MFSVSALSMAQKCPLLWSMEAGTETPPAESRRCSSLVLSSQVAFCNSLWAEELGLACPAPAMEFHM